MPWRWEVRRQSRPRGMVTRLLIDYRTYIYICFFHARNGLKRAILLRAPFDVSHFLPSPLLRERACIVNPNWAVKKRALRSLFLIVGEVLGCTLGISELATLVHQRAWWKHVWKSRGWSVRVTQIAISLIVILPGNKKSRESLYCIISFFSLALGFLRTERIMMIG